MPALDVDAIPTFVALGGTFGGHEDVAGDPAWPPSLWTVPDSAIVPEGDAIEIPPYVEEVVIGPEPAAVIGEPLWRADEAEAAAAVKGFTVSNDVATVGEFPGFPYPGQEEPSGRGYKIMRTFSPTLSRYEALDADEATDLTVAAFVDGEQVVEGTTADLSWTVGELVAHASRIVALRENDVISLGDPAHPEVLVDDADSVTCRVEGIGELTNPVRQVD